MGVTPCVSHPRQEQRVSWYPVAGNSPQKATHCSTESQQSHLGQWEMLEGSCRHYLFSFQRLFSVLQPHLSTQEVPPMSVCSTSPLALALRTVLHICGVPRRFEGILGIWQGAVQNEDSRALVSLPVLAKWKKPIRENSFIVVC